jgi:hypothetical protein
MRGGILLHLVVFLDGEVKYYMEELTKDLLLQIYNMDRKQGSNPSYDKFEGAGSRRTQHIVYHLSILESAGLIRFTKSPPYETGGPRNPEYKNNAVLIWWEEIKITDSGIRFLENEKLI